MEFKRTSKAHPYWLSTIQEILLPELPAEAIPEPLRPTIISVVEAITRGEYVSAHRVIVTNLSQSSIDPRLDAFLAGAQALCECRVGDAAAASETLAGAMRRCPGNDRLAYFTGVVLLKRAEYAAAVQAFEQAVRLNPDLGPAWSALAIIYCLEQEHEATEQAARHVLRLDYASPSRLVDLALMQATYCQGKAPEGAFSFQTLGDSAVEGLPALIHRFPPVDPASLKHSAGGLPIYFVYADHAYVVRHATPLLLSLGETRARCSIHLHVANPGRGFREHIERLRASLGDIPLVVSTESVFVEQYASPPVYHSCIRLLRLYQLVQANSSPVVMLDADNLARHDPQSLLAEVDPDADVILARSGSDPLWSRFPACYMRVRPTPAALDFMARVVAFTLDNFVRGTTRWFLDQLALSVCHDKTRSRTRFDYISMACFDGVEFSEKSVFWAPVNEEKHADNAYTRTKASLCHRYGFPTDLTAEPYSPRLVQGEEGPFLTECSRDTASAEAKELLPRRSVEIKLLTSLSRAGHTILDLGAGCGDVTVPLARVVQSHGTVYAVEADRLTCQTLVANVALAGLTNVHHACGDAKAVEAFRMPACHVIRIGRSMQDARTLRAIGDVLRSHWPIVYVSETVDIDDKAFDSLRVAGYRLLVYSADGHASGILCLPPQSWLAYQGFASR